MDFLQETEIIKLVKVRADLRGSCMISVVAEEVLHYRLPLSEQEKIAEKIVIDNAFYLERKNAELIIHKHASYRFENVQQKAKKYSGVKTVIGGGLIIHAVLLCIHFLIHETKPAGPDYSNIRIIIDSSRFKAGLIQLVDSIKDEAQRNQFDKRGMRTGKWDLVKLGRKRGFETYLNDTLNGPSREWINHESQIMETNYLSGKEHGLRKYFNNGILSMVVKYDMGQAVWSGYPSVDSHFPKSIKGFGIEKDCTLILCPHENDTLWYKGAFINKKPVGIHKMNYKNGKRHFEYNYKTLKIKTFDSTGKFISEKKDDGTWFADIEKEKNKKK